MKTPKSNQKRSKLNILIFWKNAKTRVPSTIISTIIGILSNPRASLKLLQNANSLTVTIITACSWIDASLLAAHASIVNSLLIATTLICSYGLKHISLAPKWARIIQNAFLATYITANIRSSLVITINALKSNQLTNATTTRNRLAKILWIALTLWACNRIASIISLTIIYWNLFT